MLNRGIRKSNSGFVMLAVMFMAALMVPLAISGAYMQLRGQKATLKRSIQDRQLNWMAWSAINRTQYELQQLVATEGLDDESVFPEVLPGETPEKVVALDPLMEGWRSSFKVNFDLFLDSQASDFSRFTVNSFEFAQNCTNCFASVKENDGNFATFILESRVEFPAAQMTGAVRKIGQSITIGASNIANYSVFYYDNFVTNPGTNTTYGGPMYVRGNAYITPNKNTTLTMTFNEATNADDNYDKGTFALEASGKIFWFGPRETGPVPLVQSNPTKNYEADVYGNPVFYYYLSNNDPGWVDTDTPLNGLDPDEKSTIQVKNNDPRNFNSVPTPNSDEAFTDIVGSGVPAPTLRQYFERVKSSKDITGTFVPHTEITSPASTKIHTTLAYNSVSTGYDTFVNPAWSTFLNTNFKVSTPEGDYYLLRDGAEVRTLQIGGVSEPHKLIELANDSDPASLRKFKYHWMARIPPTGMKGLALDFREYNTSDSEDPRDWEVAYNPVNGFISILDSGVKQYRDERRSTSAGAVNLKIIEVDIQKLKTLIENPAGPFPGSATNAFLLYIGLDETDPAYNIMDYVVRLVNGAALPDYGLTVASNAFVQIRGDYNTTDYVPGPPAPPAEAAGCEMKPAAVIADQIMVLSNSWSDFNIGGPAPPSYTNPSDGLSYSSPLDVDGIPYDWSQFQSHVIRGTNPDVEINAMLISGNIQDQRISQTQYDDDLGLPENSVSERHNSEYTASNLTGIWASNIPWLSRDRRIRSFRFTPESQARAAYLSGREIRNQNFARTCIRQVYHSNGSAVDTAVNTNIQSNCIPSGITNPTSGLTCGSLNVNSADFAEHAQICGADPTCMINQNPDPADRTAAIACMDALYDNVPVKIVASYDATTDVPVYQNVMVGGVPATVGMLFNSVNCPKCNAHDPAVPPTAVTATPDRDVPLYLKVDENGNILTNDINNNHIPENDTALLENNRIKAGVRFAALSISGPLMAGTPRFVFPAASVSIGCCNPVQPTYQCTVPAEAVNCGVHCPDPSGTDPNCPAGSACPSGEQSDCNYPPQCYQATCPPNYSAPPTCPSGTTCNKIENFVFPTSVQIVYTIGGYNRLNYSSLPGNNNYQINKRRYLYLPYYRPIYSGGHENLIRLGENWNHWDCAAGAPPSSCSEDGKNKLTILGTMHALWEARTLKMHDGTRRAYWSDKTYIAPEREFNYANSLRDDVCKPAGIPASIQLTVEGFQQE